MKVFFRAFILLWENDAHNDAQAGMSLRPRREISKWIAWTCAMEGVFGNSRSGRQDGAPELGAFQQSDLSFSSNPFAIKAQLFVNGFVFPHRSHCKRILQIHQNN